MTKSKMKPGWYRVNNSNVFKYFDGEYLFDSNPLEIDEKPELKFFIGPRKEPRRKSLRFLFIAIGLLIFFIGFVFIGLFVPVNGPAIDLLSRLITLSLLAVLSTKVGYRWFDAFFGLIPFYGAYFVGKILWRASVLPHRYWSIREQTEALDSSNLLTANNSESSAIEFTENLTDTKYVKNESFGALNLLRKLLGKSRKRSVSIIVISLIFSSLAIVSLSKGVYNPFECRSLSQELKNQDLIGRDLWNAYQAEVSNLNNFQPYSEQYYQQVQNVARRMIQVFESDRLGYEKIMDKPRCARNLFNVEDRLLTVESQLAYLQGAKMGDDGSYWSP